MPGTLLQHTDAKLASGFSCTGGFTAPLKVTQRLPFRGGLVCTCSCAEGLASPLKGDLQYVISCFIPENADPLHLLIQLIGLY